jgi:catechol 2,3-dioxygenase-like lactoylglutathione lyase family enzyme
MSLSGVVLDSPDAQELSAFYRRLLGWDARDDDSDWVVLQSPDGGTNLSFQSEPVYVRPVWPSGPEQQMMAHLDIKVDDLDEAVAWATEAGATLADFQPQDHVRVCLDPAGHPFCLFL